MVFTPPQASASGLRFWLRRLVRSAAPLAVAASLFAAGSAAQADDSYWNSGTAAGNFWSTGTNWSNGVPTSTTNALTTSSGASIILGSGAQAKTLYVEGPLGGESQLTAGDLTLSDQLWINVDTGTAGGTILRLYDGGSAPVSVTANNATLGADPGKQGNIILDRQSGGNVSLNVTNTLNIGYDGSGSYVYSYPFIPTTSGSVSITAGTIQVSGLSTAGQSDYNYIGTYNTNHSVTATNLNIGIAGDQGGAENYGGSWNIGNTAIGGLATSGSNYLTVTDSGTFTNTGAFTVGVNGSNNSVYVGYADGYGTTNGTLLLTGSNDLVIGSGANSHDNSVNVYYAGSTLSANGNVVVGLDGNNNDFRVSNGSTVSSGGARLGVNAGSHDNTATLGGYNTTWTMDGSVRVGDKGSANTFFVDGGTVTLTGTGKNFYVGYDKSASNNALVVLNSGTLSVKATGADLVVSGNVTGTGANSSGNILAIAGGVVDANRTLVGDGGQIWGFDGSIKGDTIIDAGGAIGPGEFGFTFLSFTDNLDLSRGGLLNMTTSGTDSSFIDIGGTLTLGGSSSLLMTMETQIAGVAYIIAHYNSLAGEFATVNGLPDASWYVDYNYLGLNEIAIVSNVPEIDPSSFGSAFALLMGALGIVERRTRRRLGLMSAT